MFFHKTRFHWSASKWAQEWQCWEWIPNPWSDQSCHANTSQRRLYFMCFVFHVWFCVSNSAAVPVVKLTRKKFITSRITLERINQRVTKRTVVADLWSQGIKSGWLSRITSGVQYCCFASLAYSFHVFRFLETKKCRIWMQQFGNKLFLITLCCVSTHVAMYVATKCTGPQT